MNDLIVKSVDVMGDSVVAAQDKDGVIWVGVKWMCNGMGMTEGHIKRQIANIQKDLLLKRGGSNLILPTENCKQEVFCLQNDYLPIWLAKISITPKIQQDHPELAEKLLDYQLKAKDILAAAFMPKQAIVPQTIPEQIQLLAQGNVELNKRVDEVQEEVNTVKNDLESFKLDLPLLPIEAERIVKAAKKKGVEVLGGKEAKAYKTLVIRQKVYTDLYWEMKHQFNVRSYKEICRRDVDRAIAIIEKYEPPLYLEKEIAEANK